MAKLTVRDVIESKNKRLLTEVLVGTPEEAAACEEAGIDLLVAGAKTLEDAREIRDAAPNTFCIYGVPYGHCASTTEAIAAGFRCLEMGADAVYTVMSTEFMAAMARESIPLIGHVGLIPYKNTWTGGFRAVGKTAGEARRIYEDTVALQDAGVIAVEMEVVPHQVAAEICKRVEIIVISMGSGANCDAQYLFATDILGTNRGHVPRHAKTYRNFAAELDRLQIERIAALREFRDDVLGGTFPSGQHTVEAAEGEFAKFKAGLDSEKN